MLLVFEPVELVARLAAMLPKPGSNAISYHGVLGARAAQDSGPAARPRAHTWADLLWRLYQANPWNCPYCGCRMLLKALVLPPAAIRTADGINGAAKKPRARRQGLRPQSEPPNNVIPLLTRSPQTAGWVWSATIQPTWPTIPLL